MHRSSKAPPLRHHGLIPAPRIGIVGGGQLAKMTAMSASQFGCEIVVLEQGEDFPAHSLDTHAIIGDYNDSALLNELGALVDVVILENEFVDLEALSALVAGGRTLWPKVGTLALVQDKLLQKQTFEQAGLPLPRYDAVRSPAEVEQFGFPAVLKKRRNSYDGKGNATLHSATDIARAWAQLEGDRNQLYIEEYCRFETELAIIITRGQDGTVAAYPVVETINRDHVCHVVKAPAAVAPPVASEATRIARTAVEAIDGVGSFGVELFLRADGYLMLNEIAPRVHNTGHYTIEACVCSQFENHLRAVLGWPLGSTELLAPTACMVNLLGYGEGSGVPSGFREAMGISGAHIHVYGKSRSQRGRKMGHITALGSTMDEASTIAQRAADCIRFGGD